MLAGLTSGAGNDVCCIYCTGYKSYRSSFLRPPPCCCSCWLLLRHVHTNKCHCTPHPTQHHPPVDHPTQVFAGDQFAIEQARHQLRLEFLRHKDVRDPHELRESSGNPIIISLNVLC
jgi:hypothetical protein